MTGVIVTQEDIDLVPAIWRLALNNDISADEAIRQASELLAHHRIKAALAMQERAAEVAERSIEKATKEFWTGWSALKYIAVAIRNLEVPE